MADFNWIQSIDVTLAGSGVSSSATSVDVVGFTLPDGTPITTAMLGTAAVGYGTFEPETSREENFSFTGVTDNGSNSYTLTGVTRGLKFVSPYTADATLQLPHSGSTILRLTNSAPFYNEFSVKRNAETITGAKTFLQLIGTPTGTSSDTDKAASIEYVNNATTAGANNASLTVKGIVQMATTAQTNSGTSSGSTGADLAVRPDQLAASIYGLQLPSSGQKDALAGTSSTPSSANPYVTKNDQANNTTVRAYATAVGGTADAITLTFSPSLTSLVEGMKIRFKATGDNTTAVTVNPSGLGAVAVKLSPNTALAGGEIKSGAETEITYDGTNFQLSVVPAALIAGISSPLTTLHAHKRVPVTFTYDLSTASGSVAVAHGLGAVPNWVELRSYLTVTNGLLDMRSDGGWNGDGTYSCVFATDTTVSSSTSFVARVYDLSGTDYQTATLTADATNVTFSWTKTSTPTGTAYFTMWTGV